MQGRHLVPNAVRYGMMNFVRGMGDADLVYTGVKPTWRYVAYIHSCIYACPLPLHESIVAFKSTDEDPSYWVVEGSCQSAVPLFAAFHLCTSSNIFMGFKTCKSWLRGKSRPVKFVIIFNIKSCLLHLHHQVQQGQSHKLYGAVNSFHVQDNAFECISCGIARQKKQHVALRASCRGDGQ